MIADLELWRCFEAAVSFHTFRRAARELSLTMRMFEYRIERLEQALGVTLFVRSAGHCRLTPDGVRLLPEAYRVLGHAAAVDAPRASGPPIELTVGAPVDLGVSWLARSFERLHAARPARTLRVNLAEPDELIAKVKSGALDCAITSDDRVEDGLTCEILHRQDYVFVASPGLLRKRRLSQGSHAPEHVLIDLGDDLPLFRYLLEALGEAAPWRFARIECFDSTAAIRERVLDGAGVAVLPRRVVGRDLQARRLKHLMRDLKLREEVFVLMWRGDHVHDGELRGLAADLARAPL